jgi:hypothetical protein
MQRFEDMYVRVLEEKYYTYRMPEDKSLSMYDFYVLDYLNYILDQPAKNFRDLPTDLEDSVRDAVKTLYPALREELLNAVFYAICAEIRHAESHAPFNRNLVKSNPKYEEIYKFWRKYQNFHGKSSEQKEELENLYDIRKPSTDQRTPESELQNDTRRNLSYKAANYTLKKTGHSRSDFVDMCEYLYRDGSWNSSYGGKAWAGICAGWTMLNQSDKIDVTVKGFDDKSKRPQSSQKPMGVAIDHIYDLQHNTDTVFNKLKAYYNRGYSWIKTALDDKANVRSYHHLLNKCSGTVKAMALPVLYNKLGTTWEKEMKIESPKKVNPPTQSPTTPSSNSKYKYKVGDVITYKSHAGENIKFVIKSMGRGYYTYDIYHDDNLKHKDNSYPFKELESHVKNSSGTVQPTNTPHVPEIGDIYKGKYSGGEYYVKEIDGIEVYMASKNDPDDYDIYTKSSIMGPDSLFTFVKSGNRNKSSNKITEKDIAVGDWFKWTNQNYKITNIDKVTGTVHFYNTDTNDPNYLEMDTLLKQINKDVYTFKKNPNGANYTIEPGNFFYDGKTSNPEVIYKVTEVDIDKDKAYYMKLTKNFTPIAGQTNLTSLYTSIESKVFTLDSRPPRNFKAYHSQITDSDLGISPTLDIDVGDIIYVKDNNGDYIDGHWIVVNIRKDNVKLSSSQNGVYKTLSKQAIANSVKDGVYEIDKTNTPNSDISLKIGDKIASTMTDATFTIISQRGNSFKLKSNSGQVYTLTDKHIKEEIDSGYMKKVSKKRRQITPTYKVGDDVLITVGKLRNYPAKVVKYNPSSGYYTTVYKNISGEDITVGVMEDQMKEDWQI